MLLSKADNAILIIEQKGAASDSDDGNRFWRIHWKLYLRPGKLHQQQDVGLSEPLAPEYRSEVADYLNQSLDDNDFDQTSADDVSQKIDVYRRSLFDKLKLDKHVDALRRRCLEIHIWPDVQPGLDRPSIHSIQWEQLEDTRIWARDRHSSVQSVTVCRHVHTKKSCRTRSGNTTQGVRQDRNGTFDVLLVVARPHIHEAPEKGRKGFNVLNPGTVRSVLLQLQEELSSMDSSQKIRLEIVRPGCMKELEAHLNKRKEAFDGKRPYHVIHFDMHGGHENGKMAFLEFNGYKDEGITLNTEPVYAKNIAQLLRDHDINCVILNACMSAVADADPSANLSSVFLRNGISAVLAMSYNMHDSISKRFYSKFYSEFFVHQAPISIAASKARKALFDDRTRWNYVKKEEVLMQDWFVPVVYTSSEEPYRCSNHRPFFSRTLFTIHGLELFLPPIMSAAIYLLMFGKLCSLVKAEVGNWSNPSKSISTWQTWVIIVAPLFWPFGRKIGRLGRYWRIRQRLRVLAEDRQNVLRIEVALRRKRMVLLHSQEDVEEYASPFVDCLATIWERTHFVAFGGAVDAERFVQPKDLSFRDDWRLWVKAFTNIVYLWAYSLRRQHSSSTEEVESVVIIENLDALYPDEEEELKEKQYCVFAQSRLEGWIKEHFTTRTQQVSPYLMLTALRGRKFGHSVSEWLENGPGRCGVLDPTAMTGFVKTSQRYVDPTNASYDKDKWYDWSVSWFCGDVSRPPKKGLISALWNFWSILIEIFVCVLYKASTLEM